MSNPDRRLQRLRHLHYWTTMATISVVVLAMLAFTIPIAVHAGEGGGHIVALVAALLVDAGLSSAYLVYVRGALAMRHDASPTFTPTPGAWDDDDRD